MTTWPAYWGAAALIVLAGCGDDMVNPPSGNRDASLYLVDDWELVPRWGDPAQITAGRADQNRLVLEVQYGGGCRDHGWRAFGSPAKTLGPLIVYDILVDHAAHGDPCDAYLRDSLVVSLEPLHHVIQPGGGAVLWIRQPDGSGPVLQLWYSR